MRGGLGLTLSQFSDEFQKDGRTFYPGDDPYWTAVDLWYGVTQDLEVCLAELFGLSGPLLIIPTVVRS